MGTAAILLGSLAAAILAYGFQLFGGRVLGAVDFAPITVLWTVQYIAMMVLYAPLEHYINRETSHGRAPGITRVLIFGGTSAIITVAVILAMGDAFLLTPIHAGLGGLMVFGYAFFGYVRGRLAGSERFIDFGVITGGEAALRLALAVALVWAFRAVGLSWAMALAPFIGALWLWRTSATGPRGNFARNLTPLIAASVFAQALLGLAPLAAGALGATVALVSVIFMTFTMYRGPLWILQGLMARLLPVFVDHIQVGARQALRRWVGIVGGGGVVLAVAAYLVGASIGPAVFEALLGADFRPSPTFSGLVAAGVIIAACGGLLNQILLAMDALRSITGAWAVGFAVATVVAFTAPVAADLAIGQAFLAGELVALAGLTGVAASLLRREQVVPDVATIADAVGV